MQSKTIKDGFFVRCDIGDEVVSTLAKFAADNNISSGTVVGIGALKKITLGYYDLVGGEYHKREFDGDHELLNLSGNFAKLGSETILHCHAVISDKQCSVFGGHLFSAIVAVTGEFYIRSGETVISRGRDEQTGLNLIKI